MGRPKRVKTSGKTRMKERGMTEVTIWLDARELALIDAAAADGRTKRATWIREQAFHAAEEAQRERIREQQRDQGSR